MVYSIKFYNPFWMESIESDCKFMSQVLNELIRMHQSCTVVIHQELNFTDEFVEFSWPEVAAITGVQIRR